MSELIVKTDNRAAIRWKLLTGASALALSTYLSSAGMARAEDDARPIIWIEADTQFAIQSVDRESFLPPFVYTSPFDGAAPIANKKAPSDWDEGAKIMFEPSGSDWIMSLGVRYGKSTRHGVTYQQTRHPGLYPSLGYLYTAYQDSRATSNEKHLLLDFQAGKEVGLGLFGHDTNSVVGIGVRYAQFDSRSNFSIKSKTASVPSSYYIRYVSLEAERNFRGIGPSLSWDASTNIAGNKADGSLTFDWGVNGALLFGRQQAKGHYAKTNLFEPGWFYSQRPKVTVYQTDMPMDRSKNVIVPNLGGYAALSVQFPNAKVTLGYRYDAFFGAIDGGIDAVKKEDRSFNGPYASVSIGIGD